ncbi:TetR/AcrR family transcriptional regulator [Erythrobacter sp. HL-111]|uniref:TetR/AcrR family transcriptional regulator n=1 Tax=Erythrobacter sp. HL-111 TaxID=1798193 RepID=UPI0006D9B93C|nr:TetR/AcrR family transcriptional regulator [Erythrobacter sp. HL-111]KPP92615.1 MAG: TetR family transcriptional regulator [Erythrobacteraceae bacterium HL-111]SDS94545.1 transcriptional regulator, TetR family [Erythrobacter sp. HL-111]
MTQEAADQAQLELPPTRKGKATREKLLAAARVCFGRYGYGAVRVADIVAEAGTSHGLFYRHFQDKDAILLTVLESLNDKLRQTSARSVGEDDVLSLERLEARNIQFFADYRRDRLLLRVAREAAAQEDVSNFRRVWLQMRDRFVHRTERWIERLAASGEIAPVADVPMVAQGLCSLTEQLAYVQIGLAAEDPDDAFIERLGRSCGLIWYRTLAGGAA